MKKIRLLPKLLFLLSIFGCIAIQAQILNVPSEYSKIQDAIDASLEHDTVLVDTGRYVENIVFKGKNIVVASKYILEENTDYILKTIIDGSNGVQGDTASCVAFLHNEDSSAVIQGFTLTKGKATLVVNNGNDLIEGGGIIIFNASPSIKNNIIYGNNALAGGGGIASFNNSTPRIYNNIIAKNSAGYAGGIVLNWCGGYIRNNIVYGNETNGIYGAGGIMVWDNGADTAYVENNTVIANASSSSAGGLSTNRTGFTYVWNNLIRSNYQAVGNEIVLNNSTTFEYNNSNLNTIGNGNIDVIPEFSNALFLMANENAGIDLGNPNIKFNDIEEGSSGLALYPSQKSLSNDIGAYGGPMALAFPKYPLENIQTNNGMIFLMNVEENLTKNLVITNLSALTIIIDSIVFPSEVKGIQANAKFLNNAIAPLGTDTIPVTIIAADTLSLSDSVLIFHNATSINSPLYIPFLFDTRKEGGEKIEGLRAHWKFDETSGANVIDELGISNGTFTGSMERIDGADGYCLGFNNRGTQGVVNIPHNDSIDFGINESFSLSMLIKFDPVDYQGEVIFLIKGTTDGAGKWYALSTKNNELRFTIDDDIIKTTLTYYFPNNFDARKWHHLAAVRDNQTDKLYLYLDGEQVFSVPDNTDNSIESSSPVLLKNYNPYINTGLDDLRIYAKALTWFEIVDIYHSYTIPALSSSASLLSLSVDGYDFTEGIFEPSILEYSVILSNETSKASINAVAESYFARIDGVGNFLNIPGLASINVISEDEEETSTYTIDFTNEFTSVNTTLTDRNSFIKIYPIPTLSNLNIMVPENRIGSLVQIYDPLGKLAYSETIATQDIDIDVSQFIPGIYILRVGELSGRIIVQ